MGKGFDTFMANPYWRRIYEENRAVIADPSLIYAGQQLRLPAAQ